METILNENDLIFSKTDLKGKITYVNPTFVKISKYKMNELYGKPHNIIRHKDMPRELFKILWDEIRNGNEVFAFVKNKTKDNGYYWVFANIVLNIRSDGSTIGYSSIRVKPNRSAIDKVEKIYSSINKLDQVLKNNKLNSFNELMTELQLNPEKIKI